MDVVLDGNLLISFSYSIRSFDLTDSVGLLDYRPVRNGVTERYTELDDVGPSGFQSHHEGNGRILGRVAGCQEVDQDPAQSALRIGEARACSGSLGHTLGPVASAGIGGIREST